MVNTVPTQKVGSSMSQFPKRWKISAFQFTKVLKIFFSAEKRGFNCFVFLKIHFDSIHFVLIIEFYREDTDL